jgi:predicted nuclease with RNAse H fold
VKPNVLRASGVSRTAAGRQKDAAYREAVLALGVDLAAEAAGTALAWLEWGPDTCSVREIRCGCDDETLIDALMAADKAGIDCPFGWPVPFVEFVTAHRSGNVDVPAGARGRDWRRNLALRLTDRVVHDRTGLTPLSVSADRIGHAAMRCAALLARLARAGRPVDRSGAGVVAEVYPAASLRLWGLPHRGYKRPGDLAALGRLVDALLAAAPWLDPGACDALCRRSHDATDAVIAALTARAAYQGRIVTPRTDELAAARSEGWIALPTGSLADLRPGG